MLVFQARGVAEGLLMMGGWFFMRQYIRDQAQVAQWQADFAAPGRLTAALNYYRANQRFFARRDWPPVKVPVLGVWSRGDGALTEGQMRSSAGFVGAGFRYERIDGADHWMQLAAPGRVNALLIEFLA